MEDAAKAPASKACSQLPKERLLPQDQVKQYEPGPSAPFSIRTKFEGTIRMRVRKSLWLFVALVVLVVSLDVVVRRLSRFGGLIGWCITFSICDSPNIRRILVIGEPKPRCRRALGIRESKGLQQYHRRCYGDAQQIAKWR